MNAFFFSEQQQAAMTSGNKQTIARVRDNSRSIRNQARIAATHRGTTTTTIGMQSPPSFGSRGWDVSFDDEYSTRRKRKRAARVRRTSLLARSNMKKHSHLAPIDEIVSSDVDEDHFSNEDNISRSPHEHYYEHDEEEPTSTTSVTTCESKRPRKENPSGYYNYCNRPTILIVAMILITITAVTVGATVASSSIDNNASEAPTTTSSPSSSPTISPIHLMSHMPSTTITSTPTPTTKATEVPSSIRTIPPSQIPSLSPTTSSPTSTTLQPTVSSSSSLSSSSILPTTTTTKTTVTSFPTSSSSLFHCDETTVRVTVYTDNYPKQLTWQLIDGNGNYHAESQSQSQSSPKYNIPNYQYPIETYCVSNNACIFSIYDSTGNGYGGYVLVERTNKLHELGNNHHVVVEEQRKYHLLWMNICN